MIVAIFFVMFVATFLVITVITSITIYKGTRTVHRVFDQALEEAQRQRDHEEQRRQPDYGLQVCPYCESKVPIGGECESCGAPLGDPRS